MPSTYLALLRGVNVGGKNKLPMKDLATMFIAAGCEDVKTFIQSGNVVFRASARVAARVPRLVAGQITQTLGFQTTVVLRSAAELRQVVLNNPFIAQGAAEDALFVLFLADLPGPGPVASLDPDRSPPDRFIVLGQEIYLQLINGAATTRLTNAYFDAKLKTTSTGRNWRTVTKLLQLVEA